MKKLLKYAGVAAMGFVTGFAVCIHLYSELEDVVKKEQDDCDEFECSDLD